MLIHLQDVWNWAQRASVSRTRFSSCILRPGGSGVHPCTSPRKAGAGRMQITRADEPSLVHVDLRFTKPFKSENDMTMTFVPEGPTGSQTRVTWTLVGPKTFMTKVMGIFTSMDKMVGPDFEKGLRQLKDLAERPGG